MQKNDNNWKKSNMYQFTTFYIQPLLLWVGAIFICRLVMFGLKRIEIRSYNILKQRFFLINRALDPVIIPTEAGQIVKQRLLNFVRSLSTVLGLAYCLSRLVLNLFTETYHWLEIFLCILLILPVCSTFDIRVPFIDLGDSILQPLPEEF